jgi:hypothetical protein
MKDKLLLFTIFALIFSLNINHMQAQTYDSLWKEVEKQENENLPKSAYKAANKIYLKASAEQNSPQLLKSFIYRMKFKNDYEEDAFETLLAELDSTVKTANFPEKAIMHSMLADMYLMYYRANRYKFINRSNTVNFDNDDIKTWTLDFLASKVISEYQKSLENKEALQKIPVEKFDLLLTGNKEELRPTLYDFLAHKALDVFRQTELSLTKPIEYFEISEDYYFQTAQRFVENDFESDDTLSFQYQSVLIFKDLLSFRLNNKNNTAALINADLRRLNYVYDKSVNPEKDELFLRTLKILEKQYLTHTAVAQVKYAIANYYFENASQYIPGEESTSEFKDNRKKAHEICSGIVSAYPKTEAAEKAKGLISQIETHNLQVKHETVAVPGKKFPLRLDYKNIDKVYVRVAAIDRDDYQKINEKHYAYEEYEELLKKSKTVYEFSKELPKDPDFNQHSVQLILDELPIGFYIIFTSDNEKYTYNEAQTNYSVLTVSNLAFAKQSNKDNSYTFIVFDRTNGQPLKDVKCDIFTRKYSGVLSKYVTEKKGSLTTDKNGMVKLRSNFGRSESVFLEYRYEDDFLSSQGNYYIYDSSYEEHSSLSTKIFTDRAIYRPGQTIHFKGLALRSKGEHTQIVPIYKETVKLLDPNYQEVAKLELTTNEFGTYSGSFAIPRNLRNGNFIVQAHNGSRHVKVEEYKRPKFETELLPFDGNYLLSDKIPVKGKAISFSGAPLSDANVRYRIKRSPRWWGWWSYFIRQQETEIANGTCKTNDKGIYEFDFKAVPDRSIKKSPYLAFNYSISIDVTDINGETQSTSGNIQVGYRALKLNTNISENTDIQKLKENPKNASVQIFTQNLNGEFIPASGSIKVYRLKSPDVIYKTRYWEATDKHLYTPEEWEEILPGHLRVNENMPESFEKEKLIFESKFNTADNKHVDFSFLKDKPQGKYLIELEAKDAFDNPVSNKSFFTLINSESSEMPSALPFHFESLKKQCEPGEKAEFLIGTSYKNTRVLYQVEHKNEIVKQEFIKLNNETKHIEIPVEEKHRGNFSVHFIFVKENRFYNKSEVVIVPFSNKKLDVEFSTFRDKLLPGQKEEWRVTIKDSEGQKAIAEMLAGMYDASLDQFVANHWSLNIYPHLYTRMSWSQEHFSSKAGQLLKKDIDNIYYPSLSSYQSFNWFGFSYYAYREYDIMYSAESGNVRRKSLSRDKKTAEEPMLDEIVVESSEEETISGQKNDAEFERSDTSTIAETTSEKSVDFGDIKVRTNFNETAFFYPHLRTNEDGEIVISFTVPESLTKWKLMTLSHTKDLKYGLREKEIITQKDLMLMPNSPRFFRENDKISFPVKISSLSKESLEGQIQLEFIDPITNKPISGMFAKGEKQNKSFSLKPEGNTNVEWNLQIPEGLGAVSYKVVAKAGKFSDGEQKALPVLINRMLVTESLPLPVKGNSEKTLEFTKLINSGKSSTLKHHKLTLEFTSNPAWYAVQALPYIMEYPYECSEQIFSRFYANSLASFIANSDPKIARVFEAWRTTDTEALVSNLEKNEELKSVLLQETPWVMDGKDESERKKRIGLLFDMNRMQNESRESLNELAKKQYANGGWPWFSGMPESRYITQHIVTGMGHLKHLNVISKDNMQINRMIRKAVGYLDSKITYDYNQLKKHYTAQEMQEDHLSYIAVHYLYGRSFYTDIPIPNQSREAVDYFKGQAKKYWTKRNMYSQGMIALGLHRTDDSDVPAKIAKSLKEYSTVHDELGRYWKDNVSGWYWYQAPIETQALMIEVFTEVTEQPETVEELKIWLLKQKQTQDWKTTKATAEAIYALLLQGADLLASDAITEVYLNNKLIDPNTIDGIRPQAGTGYFKTSWSGGEIKPEMGRVKLVKKDAGIAWGALYWQYFEQLDKITPHETPLSLKKQLFVERQTDRGPVIEPVSKSEIRVGDKIIVRIELRSDRRMEYIHLKDMRASGFEPINVFSRYKYQDGLGYYESTKDASTNFFIEHLPKGTFVFEYPLRVAHKGDFSNGITTIQCMYAPEFSSHSEGVRVKVK